MPSFSNVRGSNWLLYIGLYSNFFPVLKPAKLADGTLDVVPESRKNVHLRSFASPGARFDMTMASCVSFVCPVCPSTP